jgi:hypothetical protein
VKQVRQVRQVQQVQWAWLAAAIPAGHFAPAYSQPRPRHAPQRSASSSHDWRKRARHSPAATLASAARKRRESRLHASGAHDDAPPTLQASTSPTSSAR